MLFSSASLLRTLLYFTSCAKATARLSLCLFIAFHSPELSQVKRHTVAAIDHPGSATDKTHTMYLHRENKTPFPPDTHYTDTRYLRLNTSVAESHLQSSCHIVQYHFIILHYMPCLHLAGSICWHILVILHSALCKSSGWQLWLAIFQCFRAQYSMPSHKAISCILHHSPHLLLFVFVAAMWVHLPFKPTSHLLAHHHNTSCSYYIC
ncbi:MAG: hypothetical protein IPN89_11925 [Saprospiraceae bacterium]|nr:hypothetical protein [Saprospiraceae bacterium]